MQSFQLDLHQQQDATADILDKKQMAGASSCSLCSSNAETANHLFLKYLFSKVAWNFTAIACKIKD